MRRRRSTNRSFIVGIVCVILVVGFVFFGNYAFLAFEDNAASVSVGTVARGELMNGKRLPTSGPNFHTYSYLGSSIGRTCVHEKVRTTMLGSYQSMFKSHPEHTFVFGETAWCWGGGDLYPHRTHQNGLSVDFMVPVTQFETPGRLRTTALNKWGYGVDFDTDGRSPKYEIDFEAIGSHLLAIAAEAEKNGLAVSRVIFDPTLQKKLKKTKSGKAALRKLPFNKSGAWVRHDDHYHVDFRVRR